MRIEFPSPILNERTRDLLLEPQSHVGDTINKMDSMLKESMRRDGGVVLNSPFADFPITADYEVKNHDGGVGNLKIGVTNWDMERRPEYIIDYEGFDKVIFVGDRSIATLDRTSIKKPDDITSDNSNHLRRELIHPADFDLINRVLIAAETGEVLSQEPTTYSAK